MAQIGQRVRSTVLLGAVVALIAGVALVGAGKPAQAAACAFPSNSSGGGSASIAVNPCTGLSDAQDVNITGTGFTPNQGVTIIMCDSAPSTTNDCDQGGGSNGTADADGSGNIDETFTVTKTFTTEGGTDITCNNSSTSPNCSILVTSGIPTTDVGAYQDVNFGAPTTTTTTTTASTTTTTGGGSTTTTTTTAAGTCPTGGVTTSPSVTVSPLQPTPGSAVTVTGTGFPKDAHVNINLCSSPVLLITAVIDGSGNLAATSVTIPATASLGAHEVVVQLANNPAQAGVASITLVASTVTPTPVATPTEATPTFTG